MYISAFLRVGVDWNRVELRHSGVEGQLHFGIVAFWSGGMAWYRMKFKADRGIQSLRVVEAEEWPFCLPGVVGGGEFGAVRGGRVGVEQR